MTPPAGGSAARRLRLEAPAKVNLTLRIVGQRPDGYHLLDSCFVPLGLSDALELDVVEASGRRDVQLSLDSEGGAPVDTVPTDDRNLAVRLEPQAEHWQKILGNGGTGDDGGGHCSIHAGRKKHNLRDDRNRQHIMGR